MNDELRETAIRDLIRKTMKEQQHAAPDYMAHRLKTVLRDYVLGEAELKDFIEQVKREEQSRR